MVSPLHRSKAPGLVMETSPVTRYLAQQQMLDTPVLRFSDAHDRLSQEGISQFQTLIPLSLPEAGQQYAFEVDLDRCTGCKACVAGCHSMNGLRDEETWRDVGLVHGYIESQAYQQTVTTACHHCADPACLNGCPVLAYEKDPITGIVRHLDDQCIGCQYCVLKCPYEVPKYNKSLGIVRKCDMCHSRLSTGEAPACVQACPTEAIRISIVTIPSRDRPLSFLPSAPDPIYTLPTTRYHTRREIPDNLIAADAQSPRIEDAHYPLVVMLTLTQGGVGSLMAAVGAEVCGEPDVARFTAAAGTLLLLAGLAASVFHLGRPLGAWRAFLGLRRSWLSREIVAFGGLAPIALTYTATRWGAPIPSWLSDPAPFLLVPLALAAAYSSAMIYVDTHRENWRLGITMAEFCGTIGAIGLGVAMVAAALQGEMPPILISGWFLVIAGILAIDRSRAHKLATTDATGLRARLLDGPLKERMRARRMCLVAAVVLALGGTIAGPPLLVASLVATVFGEFLGRALYFQAVIAPKMPGGYTR